MNQAEKDKIVTRFINMNWTDRLAFMLLREVSWNLEHLQEKLEDLSEVISDSDITEELKWKIENRKDDIKWAIEWNLLALKEAGYQQITAEFLDSFMSEFVKNKPNDVKIIKTWRQQQKAIYYHKEKLWSVIYELWENYGKYGKNGTLNIDYSQDKYLVIELINDIKSDQEMWQVKSSKKWMGLNKEKMEFCKWVYSSKSIAKNQRLTKLCFKYINL